MKAAHVINVVQCLVNSKLNNNNNNKFQPCSQLGIPEIHRSSPTNPFTFKNKLPVIYF